MKAIVSVDLNWGIGFKGNLLQRIPEDMKNFKRLTIGKVVVMGRETFESLPKKEPLKDRVNIVLSKDKNFNNEKVIICRSIEELFNELKKYNSEDIFIIGGDSVYKQLIPHCNMVYITRIEKEFTADRYFKNLDNDKSWKLESVSELQEFNGIQYRYTKYISVKV